MSARIDRFSTQTFSKAIASLNTRIFVIDKNVLLFKTNIFFDDAVDDSYSGIRHKGKTKARMCRGHSQVPNSRNKNSALWVVGSSREVTGPDSFHDSDRSMLAVLGHAEKLVGQCALPDGECRFGRAK